MKAGLRSTTLSTLVHANIVLPPNWARRTSPLPALRWPLPNCRESKPKFFKFLFNFFFLGGEHSRKQSLMLSGLKNPPSISRTRSCQVLPHYKISSLYLIRGWNNDRGKFHKTQVRAFLAWVFLYRRGVWFSSVCARFCSFLGYLPGLCLVNPCSTNSTMSLKYPSNPCPLTTKLLNTFSQSAEPDNCQRSMADAVASLQARFQPSVHIKF
eukprot:sb/3470179/